MFESTQQLLQRYFDRAMRTSLPGLSIDHVGELRERLEQLEFLHTRIKECEQVQAVNGFENPARTMGNFFQLKLYVEAFYMFAGRVMQFTSHDSKPLPGLKFKASGVTLVRNHLIQHPEGANSLNFQQNFGFDPEHGMMLKNGRIPGQPKGFLDKGFTVNCAEFKAALEAALKKAVK